MTNIEKETLIIKSQSDVTRALQIIENNASKTIENLQKSKQSYITIFINTRFEKVGRYPFADGNDNEKLNFTEQLNQTSTYITALKAIEFLLDAHPDANGFKMGYATHSGFDILSVKENFIAVEIFAAVDVTNNNKLNNDIKKLREENALKFEHRYIFHMTPKNKETKLIEEKYGIKIYSIGYDKI
ncbi:MAG: hypothetical protein K0U45_00615 [Alphaproteobacteria bacterium]|nr:hypothetical protein [Alphaproteobacteria bacterium]